ncbi:MAG: hypothetical protein Q8S02_11815 [Hydrogenophaga sp.]|nr:hypothetical protein [Hydrogenophaga sp.]
MDFRTVATLGALVTLPFGLMFLATPAQAAALYGHVASEAYTLFMGRLFGVQLLLFGGALWALRGAREANVQRTAAMALASFTTLGTVVTAWGVLSGAVNAMGWTSVAVYGFFIVAWGRVALSAGQTRAAV